MDFQDSQPGLDEPKGALIILSFFVTEVRGELSSNVEQFEMNRDNVPGGPFRASNDSANPTIGRGSQNLSFKF